MASWRRSVMACHYKSRINIYFLSRWVSDCNNGGRGRPAGTSCRIGQILWEKHKFSLWYNFGRLRECKFSLWYISFGCGASVFTVGAAAFGKVFNVPRKFSETLAFVVVRSPFDRRRRLVAHSFFSVAHSFFPASSQCHLGLAKIAQ